MGREREEGNCGEDGEKERGGRDETEKERKGDKGGRLRGWWC